MFSKGDALSVHFVWGGDIDIVSDSYIICNGASVVQYNFNRCIYPVTFGLAGYYWCHCLDLLLNKLMFCFYKKKKPSNQWLESTNKLELLFFLSPFPLRTNFLDWNQYFNTRNTAHVDLVVSLGT